MGADTGQGDDLTETFVGTLNLSEGLEENGLLAEGMDPGWIRLLRSRWVNVD